MTMRATGGRRPAGVRRLLAVSLAAATVLAAPVAGAEPIPDDPLPPAGPAYVGHPATPRPDWVPAAPRHPAMASNQKSNIHADAYQTDTNRWAGPLGRDPRVTSSFQVAECASLTFDSRGRVETVCVGLEAPRLVLMDPVTLEVLATHPLPPRTPAADTLSDFSGGGYFYLDDRDRAVVPTTDRHVVVIAQTNGPGGPGFRQVRDHDVSGLMAGDDKIVSALPDWSGRIVFVTKAGVVGSIDPASGRAHRLVLGEEIANSFAVDEDGGIYVVSARAMYRLDHDRRGRLGVTWREVYANSGELKPGQVSAGSGTTPTVMGRRWVAITDNADPMRVVVYRRGAEVRGRREVCSVPVFRRGASATDNSLIAAGRALVVTNNYGYDGPVRDALGGTSEPGIERIDVDRDGRGCRRVWRNTTARSASAVPKLSLATGLVYTVTKRPATGQDLWYLTALDFRTGRLVWQQRYGTGLGFNNNYAPVSLARTGVAYVGVLGGLVRVADAVRTRVPAARPVLRLRSRAGRTVVAGPDREFVTSVVFRRGDRVVARDHRAPFTAPGPRRGLRAAVRLEDGTRVRLPRR